MRSLFYPVIGLSLLILGAIGWLLLSPSGSWWPQLSGIAAAIMPQASPKRPQPADPPPKASPKRARSGVRHSGRVEVSVEAIPTMPAFDRVETGHRFPVGQDIQQGTPKSVILAMYGKPQLTVTLANVGQLFERYIYIDKPTGRKTSVFFANAMVTGAQTATE